MLDHGGNLHEAARRFGIAESQWLDLSTGINPNGWPVPAIPAEHWQRLPDPYRELAEAACCYYQCDSLLPVAGSQAAIQALPTLLRRNHGVERVGLLSPCYGEHPHAWQKAGCQVMELELAEVEEALPQLDLLLLCNPNNPDGRLVPCRQLLEWHRVLRHKGGWLLVDEAFMDSTPEHSLSPLAPLPRLILLRSLGKFFGLAGARVGFVLAQPDLLDALQEQLGPWGITGPSAWVATRALKDTAWQARARLQLRRQAAELSRMLQHAHLEISGGTDLFRYLVHQQAASIYRLLARQGLLVRHFPQWSALRFGLPGSQRDFRRLEQALNGLRKFRCGDVVTGGATSDGSVRSD